MTVTLRITAGLLLVLGLTRLGIAIVRTVVQSRDEWGYAGTYFPVGFGVATYIAFLMSWAGLPITSWSVLGLLTVLLIAGTATELWFAHRRFRPNQRPGPRRVKFTLPLWALVPLAGIVIASATLAVGRSYSTWDEMAAYSIKGYGIALDGSISAATSWGSGAGYPLNVPLGISMFDLLQGDSEPLSKLIFSLFFGSTILGIYQFWARTGVRQGHAVLGAGLLATIPAVFVHGTIGYVNLPFACYLTLGALQVIDGVSRHSTHQQVLGGILLALSTWTRPDGLIVASLVSVGVLVAARISRWNKPALWALLGPIGAVGGAWQFYSWQVSPGGAQTSMLSMARAFIEGISKGEFNLDAFYWIARFMGGQLSDPKVWGLAFPVGVFVILLKRRVVGRRALQSSFALLVLSLLVSASLVFFYYLVSFSSDLIYWLGTDINRMMLPISLLGWAWLFSHWSGEGTVIA